ncbi:hypothetical protein M0657_010951 [Pyricularia oryzae]|nr:hypothetical protein M9X92_011856 [Pyricularia oryzae]KAI7911466.1 hypothetical protein M0657_010951 [Pyricularia oryzae]
MAIHQSRAITTHSYNVGCSNLGVAFTSHFSNLLFAPNCTCRHARSYRTRLHPVRSTAPRVGAAPAQGGSARVEYNKDEYYNRCKAVLKEPGPRATTGEAQFQVPGCYHFIVKPSKDCTSYEMKKHEVTKDCPRYKDLPWEITVEPALVPPLHGPGIKIRKKAPASAKVPEPKPKGRSSSSGGKDETTSITTDQA